MTCMDTMRLITITDGSPTVAITLQVFFSSLLESGASETFDEIVLLSPHYSLQDQIDKLVCVFSELKIKNITIMFTNPYNRYFTKLMLREYLNRDFLSSDEILCYLDYDHIFRKPIKIKSTLNINSAIYLSSEVLSISSALLDGKHSLVLGHQLLDVHFNTSLILGKTILLSRAMRLWQERYIRCTEVVSPRYLEEIAFSMSALSQNIEIFPIPPTVQGNWQHNNEDWIMFHYGGESQIARKIKQEIPIILGQEISLASRDTSIAVTKYIEELIFKSTE